MPSMPLWVVFLVFPVTLSLSLTYSAVFTMIAALDGSLVYIQKFTEQAFDALL